MKSALCGYYGGKANIAGRIARLIYSAGELRFYAEPFAGGASVYFALNPRRGGFYVLNDTNSALINFYEVMHSDFPAFYDLAQARGVYAKAHWERARAIYSGETAAADKIESAWAMWYSVHTSFSGILSAGFRRNTDDRINVSNARTLEIKLAALQAQAEILQFAQFECEDALTFIRRYGRPGNMLYIDPPYIGKGAGYDGRANQGHYSGYTPDDFAELLSVLEDVKCQWVLSSYNDTALMEWAEKCGYGVEEIPVTVFAGCKAAAKTRRTECLFYNFSRAGGELL